MTELIKKPVVLHLHDYLLKVVFLGFVFIGFAVFFVMLDVFDTNSFSFKSAELTRSVGEALFEWAEPFIYER